MTANPSPIPAPPRPAWTARDHLPEPDFIIQSHRGAGDLAPENTLASFQLAWSIHTWPEADLRTTRDGVIVPFHDTDLSRVAPAALNQPLADLTWSELSQIDVGAGHRVPTLAAVFTALRADPRRHLYLDLKHADLHQLAALVREHQVQHQIALAAPDPAPLRHWKHLVPESDTLLWMGGPEPQLTQRLADLRQTHFAALTQLQIHVHLDPFTPSAQFLRDTGAELRAHHILFQTLPWHAAHPAVYTKLLDLGVMSFATDRPDIAKQALHDYYTAPH